MTDKDKKHVYVKVPLVKAGHVNANGQVFTKEALEQSAGQIIEWAEYKGAVFGEYFIDYQDRRKAVTPEYVLYADNLEYEGECLYGNINVIQHEKGKAAQYSIESLGGIEQAEVVPNCVVGAISDNGEVSDCIITSFSVIPKRDNDDA